jgi:uncharacterized protein
MKLHLSDPNGRNAITAYGSGYVTVNGERHERSLVVSPTHIETGWQPGSGEQIGAEAVRALVSLQPEIVLIGTGSRHHFPGPAALRPLIDAGIGFEVMSTAAACRTYNILVAEDRVVVAGLVI